jgi:hypothetical protein
MSRLISLTAALTLALSPAWTLHAAEDPPADPTLAQDQAKAVSDAVKRAAVFAAAWIMPSVLDATSAVARVVGEGSTVHAPLLLSPWGWLVSTLIGLAVIFRTGRCGAAETRIARFVILQRTNIRQRMRPPRPSPGLSDSWIQLNNIRRARAPLCHAPGRSGPPADSRVRR